MTINDIVQKAMEHFNDKAITYQKLEKFLFETGVKVKPDFGLQIFDYYNRKILDLHRAKGEEQYPEKYNIFADARKDLNSFIDIISKKLSLEETVSLKQKVDKLVDGAVLWEKRE